MVQHRYTTSQLRRPLRTLAGELEATAACVARYPLGLFEGALTTGRPSGESVHDTPVLLVHGYAHNESGWWVLDRRLRQAGFTSIHRLNYLPLGSGIPQLAERLAARVDEIRDLTGAERVHVIGHSMGGLLTRWYVQELGGDRRVDTVITLGSPHEGTLAAWLWPERTARDMRPGSSVISGPLGVDLLRRRPADPADLGGPSPVFRAQRDQHPRARAGALVPAGRPAGGEDRDGPVGSGRGRWRPAGPPARAAAQPAPGRGGPFSVTDFAAVTEVRY